MMWAFSGQIKKKRSVSVLLSGGLVRSDESTSRRPRCDVAAEKCFYTEGQMRRLAGVLGHQKASRDVRRCVGETRDDSSTFPSEEKPWTLRGFLNENTHNFELHSLVCPQQAFSEERGPRGSRWKDKKNPPDYLEK